MSGAKKGSKHSGYGMSRWAWFLLLRRFLLAQPGHTFEDEGGSVYRRSGVFDIGGKMIGSAGYQVGQITGEGLIRCSSSRGGTYSMTLTAKGKAFTPNKDAVRIATWMLDVKDALANGRTPPERPRGYLRDADATPLIERWLADDAQAEMKSKPAKPTEAKPAVTETYSVGNADVQTWTLGPIIASPVRSTADDAEAVAAAIVETVIRRANKPSTFNDATQVDNQRLRADLAQAKEALVRSQERAELAERNLQTLLDNLAEEKVETELAHSVTENGSVTPLLDRLSATSREELTKLMKQVPVGPT